MFDSHKKHPHFKVIFLKEMPPKQSIYHSLEINQHFNKKMSTSPSSYEQKTAQKSIAHLSSIIQDRKQHLDDLQLSNISLNEPLTFPTQVDDGSSRIIRFRQTSKQNGRYLSELLTRSHQKDVLKSNISSINKLLSDRKVYPIDRLKVGRKNISFSETNKKQLTKDFYQFVSNKSNRSVTTSVIKQPKSVTILPQKNKIQRKIYNERAKYQQRKRKWRQQAPYAQQSPRKRSKKFQQQQGGLAVYLRRLTVNIPRIKDFGWSKITDQPYNNTPYTRQI